MDTFKLKGLRERLIKSLSERGITNSLILSTMNKVLRHHFIDTALSERAYEDLALPIEDSQTISQPFTVAYQTQLLNLKAKDKVLEIGTGSGYQTAILCELGAQVFSIERSQILHKRAKRILEQEGYHPLLKLGDGTLGWPSYQPYNKILVTAGGPYIPQELLNQLVTGGCLVMPVGDKKGQRMVRITKTGDQNFQEEKLDYFSFVPLIGKDGWQL